MLVVAFGIGVIVVSRRNAASTGPPSAPPTRPAAPPPKADDTGGDGRLVIAVGNGKVLSNGEQRPVDLKVGDKVLFGKYSGNEVKIGGEELLVLREEDIMGVIEG